MSETAGGRAQHHRRDGAVPITWGVSRDSVGPKPSRVFAGHGDRHPKFRTRSDRDAGDTRAHFDDRQCCPQGAARRGSQQVLRMQWRFRRLHGTSLDRLCEFIRDHQLCWRSRHRLVRPDPTHGRVQPGRAGVTPPRVETLTATTGVRLRVHWSRLPIPALTGVEFLRLRCPCVLPCRRALEAPFTQPQSTGVLPRVRSGHSRSGLRRRNSTPVDLDAFPGKGPNSSVVLGAQSRSETEPAPGQPVREVRACLPVRP